MMLMMIDDDDDNFDDELLIMMIKISSNFILKLRIKYHSYHPSVSRHILPSHLKQG